MRQVQVADETGKVIVLSIWGDTAQKFDLSAEEHPVIAVKRAMVSDYMGKSLNSNDDC